MRAVPHSLSYLGSILLAIILLLPAGGGTSSQLLIPVYYHRVALAQSEPVLLELAVAPGEWQVAPASLGYFTNDPSTGVRRFVFSAEVPRGLLYRWQPAAAGDPAGHGRVDVIELTAPQQEALYFEDQLGVIRERVVDLNRQRNLLLQARQQQSASRSIYSHSIDALWPALNVTRIGLRDGGWTTRVLAKHPGEVPQLCEQLAREGQARAEQKHLYYSGQEARLRLLLSQFDLQRGLARLPRPRSETLLSLGDTRIVHDTVLAEIDRLQQAWQLREQELVGDCETGDILRQRLQEQAPPTGPGAAPTEPRGQLEQAVLQAWIEVQLGELAAIHGVLPVLDEARAYVSGRNAPDWSTLPRLSVKPGDLEELTLEGLRYYAVLDGGLEQADALDLLAGLARQFVTQPGSAAAAPQSEVFGNANRLRQTLDGLASGSLDASPDEVAYGLLAVERSRALVEGELGSVAQLAALPAAELAGDPQLALRAGLAGQLDLILRAPGNRNLASYDLSYLRFIRWYCALGMPPEAPPVATAPAELVTESYGFSAAAQSPARAN